MDYNALIELAKKNQIKKDEYIKTCLNKKNSRKTEKPVINREVSKKSTIPKITQPRQHFVKPNHSVCKTKKNIENEEDVSSVIKQLFGHNKYDYTPSEEECRNMESSYSSISREERISNKIAKLEDKIEYIRERKRNVHK